MAIVYDSEYTRKQVAAWRARRRRELGLPPAMSRLESSTIAANARSEYARERRIEKEKSAKR